MIVWSIVVAWTAVLAWPGDAPAWLLIVLVCVAGVGGPASMIGFDLVRTSNPDDRLASATGIVNQAGFFASLVLVIAIGVIAYQSGGLVNVNPGGWISLVGALLLLTSGFMLVSRQHRDPLFAKTSSWLEICTMSLPTS